MGIDKLRLISSLPPTKQYMGKLDHPTMGATASIKVHAEINQEFRKPTYIIQTRKNVNPGYRLELYNSRPGRRGPCHTLELNPNRLADGYEMLLNLAEEVFGSNAPDLRVSRIDLNAEIDLPVDYFFRTLRVKRKRITRKYAVDSDVLTRTDCNRGITGLAFGKSPCVLLVYDKREELRQRREEVSGLPQYLTRFEWQLRHSKTPIDQLSDIEKLKDFEPFKDLVFAECPEVYDFQDKRSRSLQRFMLNRLSRDYGLHQAARIVNQSRNFHRDYNPALVPVEGISERLQESYLRGLQSFFEGRPSEYCIPAYGGTHDYTN